MNFLESGQNIMRSLAAKYMRSYGGAHCFGCSFSVLDIGNIGKLDIFWKLMKCITMLGKLQVWYSFGQKIIGKTYSQFGVLSCFEPKDVLTLFYFKH